MKLNLFKNKAQTILALIFSFLFLSINLLCAVLNTKYHISLRYTGLLLLISLLATPLLAELFIRARKILPKLCMNPGDKETAVVFRNDDLKYFLWTFLAIFIMWIPVFLAFYPGIFAYDVMTQLINFNTGEYSAHHPLLHTLYLGFFYEILGSGLLKNHNIAVALASLCQMLIFSLSLSYTHVFLRRINVKLPIRIAAILFSGLSPVYSVLSVSTTKDIMFSGFLGLLLVSLLYFELDYESASKKPLIEITLFFSLILTMLFRSNGRYAVWAMAIVALIKFALLRKKKVLILIFSALLASELLSLGLKTGLKAEATEATEMLSIPLQQMAFVYELNYDILTPQQRQTVETIIPDVINYNRLLSDPIKFTAQYEENKELFWQTYFTFLKRYPREYIEAFLQTNLGYLYVADTTNATVYGWGYDRQRGFLMTYTRDGYDVFPHSFFPYLKDLYLRLFCQNDYQKNIFLFLPNSLGLFFWLIVAAVFTALEKKAPLLSSFILILALGATSLLGPCVLARYMLPFMVCLPPMIFSANIPNIHRAE